MTSAAERLGLWKWDPRPHGWRVDGSFGPLPGPRVAPAEPEPPRNVHELQADVEAAFTPAPVAAPTPEQIAANNLLGDARRAESRANAARWRERT